MATRPRRSLTTDEAIADAKGQVAAANRLMKESRRIVEDSRDLVDRSRDRLRTQDTPRRAPTKDAAGKH